MFLRPDGRQWAGYIAILERNAFGFLNDVFHQDAPVISTENYTVGDLSEGQWVIVEKPLGRSARHPPT
jgi:hypothetical protein